MNVHSVLEMLHGGRPLVADIQASGPGSLAWVGIYPLDLSSPRVHEFLRNHGFSESKASGFVYHIRTFEVDRDLVEKDSWISENQLRNKRSYVAFGDDDLVLKLAEIGVRLDQLTQPFKSNYPI